MNILTLIKSEKKRLLLTLLPVVLIDIIASWVSVASIGGTNIDALYKAGETPRFYELADSPHRFLILPIIFLLVELIWVCFAEKDKLFAKIVAAKAVLFAFACYFPWYYSLMWRIVPDQSIITYLNFIGIFMMQWYFVIANVVLLAAILLKAARNKGKTCAISPLA